VVGNDHGSAASALRDEGSRIRVDAAGSYKHIVYASIYVHDRDEELKNGIANEATGALTIHTA
jgi:hypothetical protein